MSKHHSNGSPLESKNGALPPSNDAFIESYTPLVRLIAERIHRRLPPGIDLGSLIHAGMVGILEARERFDPKRRVTFPLYAHYRIHGEIMEYLRSLDWVSRSIRHWGRRVESAKKRIVDRETREATAEEVAVELGISLEEYFRVEAKLDQATMVTLEDVSMTHRTHTSTIEDPETIVERASLLERLAICREELPGRERLVITLYYEEELTLQEIAEILGVTEGYICQIHTTALLFLRDIFDQPSVKKSAAVPPVSTGDEIAADLLFLLEDAPLDGEDIETSLQVLLGDL